MSAHATIAPSGLHLTVPCPGSVKMQAMAPKTADTDEELEGQAAHLVAMGVASRKWEPKLGDKFMYAGRPWEIDDDMLDGAVTYAEEAQFLGNGQFEEPVSAKHVIPECWGTPDYWRVYDYFENGTGARGIQLKVADYKYGYRHVEVFENPQLIAYALGVQHRLQLSWKTPVCLAIAQPRAFHHEGPVRHWRTLDNRPLTLADLYHFAVRVIVPAVEEALSENPQTIAGPHCVDCRARGICPTYRKDIANVLQYVGTAQLDNMTSEAVGVELRLVKWAIKMLEGRYDGLRAHAEASINAGVPIPYWRYGPVAGRLTWKPDTPKPDIAAMGDMLGVDLRKPMALVTPTQAKKVIDESIIAMYADRPSGGMKLIPDDEVQFRKAFGYASGPAKS
jgi:Protein of unknown function (DUF2800)